MKKILSFAVILLIGTVSAKAETVVYDKATGEIVESGGGDKSRFNSDNRYGFADVDLSDVSSKDLRKNKIVGGVLKEKSKIEKDSVDNSVIFRQMLELENHKTILLATKGRGVSAKVIVLIDAQIVKLDV